MGSVGSVGSGSGSKRDGRDGRDGSPSASASRGGECQESDERHPSGPNPRALPPPPKERAENGVLADGVSLASVTRLGFNPRLGLNAEGDSSLAVPHPHTTHSPASAAAVVNRDARPQGSSVGAAGEAISGEAKSHSQKCTRAHSQKVDRKVT